jgi:hypothetical protein
LSIFGLWFLIINKTKISLPIEASELTEEYISTKQNLSDLDFFRLEQNFTNSIKNIRLQGKIFWDKRFWNPVKEIFVKPIFISIFLVKVVEISIGLSTLPLSKLYEALGTFLNSPELCISMSIYFAILGLIYVEKYLDPISRLRRVRYVLRQKQTGIDENTSTSFLNTQH